MPNAIQTWYQGRLIKEGVIRYIILIVSIVLAYPTQYANATEEASSATFSQLPNQVAQEVESLNFPSPNFIEFGTVTYSQETPTSVAYGHYRIDEAKAGLVRITTGVTFNFETSDVPYDIFFFGFLDGGSTVEHELQSQGSGISAGGLISFISHGQMNIRSSNKLKFLPSSFSHKKVISSKVTELKKLSGFLFPLQVGNKLKIQLAETSSMLKGKENTRTLEYEVTKQIDDYTINSNKLPGDVFEITVHSELSNNGSAPAAKHLYSSHLGWIVESQVGNITSKLVGWE